MAGHGRGYDLLDFWRGRITPRWMWMFIRQLPPTSALRRSVPSSAGWTPTDHLTAAVIDMLRIQSWQLAGNKNARKPSPYPRPAELAKKQIDAERAVAEAQYRLEARERAQREEAERDE